MGFLIMLFQHIRVKSLFTDAHLFRFPHPIPLISDYSKQLQLEQPPASRRIFAFDLCRFYIIVGTYIVITSTLPSVFINTHLPILPNRKIKDSLQGTTLDGLIRKIFSKSIQVAKC